MPTIRRACCCRNEGLQKVLRNIRMAKRQRFPMWDHASPAHSQSHFQINKGLGAFPISERLPETKRPPA